MSKTIKLPNISQSLIKNYVDYLNEKECGLFFKAKYIDKDPEAQLVPTDAMKLGIYFEYLCTGALPKDGVIPEPEYVYKGKPNERLSVAYERVMQSAENFKKIIEHYDIKVLEVGKTIVTDGLSGVLDILAEWNGQKVVIDLKYSGLIDDKWNEMGWETESLHMKDSIMIQGVHYKLLMEKSESIKDIPFYYFVFSSQDANNIKIIKQEVDESKMQSHIVAIENIKDKLSYNISTNNFKAHPSMQKCSNCPIAHKCPSKVHVPIIQEVYY
jgi:hypothetical protein